jgi:PAS domain S-box-containing protein
MQPNNTQTSHRAVREHVRSVWTALRAARDAQRSMRGKLMRMVLLTTAIALLIAGAAMLTHDLTVYRQAWAADMKTEADILAFSTGAALAFDDHSAAERNLNALSARRSILAAALYTANGTRYAEYVRNGEESPPLSALPHVSGGLDIFGDHVQITTRIVRNGEFLGTIYLRARYQVAERFKAYIGIFALVTLLSMFVALVLSSAMQQSITAPLDAMATVARQIVDQRDYSLRARKTSDDEVGVVVQAFNNMLSEVQSRTQALEESNVALKGEIATRKAAEEALRQSQRLYRAIGESIDYGVWLCDAAGRNTYASESFLRMIGSTQQQCSDIGWSDLLHPDDVQDTLAAWFECARSGSSWYREHRFRGADGRFHPVLTHGVPIKAEDGKVVGWAGINLDISRLKRTEEALREADRRKDEFLATLAHELRNPLAPIRYAVQILDSATAHEQQRQLGRDVISRQVQQMALLLDDLLDISRITRGRFELKKGYVSLSSLVAAAVETSRPLIDSKQHTLQIDLPSAPLELEVDPLRLSQALSNLLTNAAKYTDTGGRIELSARLHEDALSIEVSDSGIGLSAAAIPNVFEMFSQVKSAIDRAEGGLGIGLALVKGLVTLHGGAVSAASAGLGKGSTFTIRLPRSVVVRREANSAMQPKTTQTITRARCKVVVADDNRDAAASLALLLEISGYEVHLAHSGREALDIGMREHPDAFVLDIGMSDLNGYDTARRIRLEAWGQHVLLLAVTGWGQHDDKERARAAGFDQHFTKPVDPNDLERALVEYSRKLRSA